MEQLYTPQEVADQLRIKKTTVYELIKRGELKSSKIGKQIRISRRHVEEYLHGQLPSPIQGDLAGGNLQREYLAAGNGLVLSGQDQILDHLALQLNFLEHSAPLLRSYMNDYNSLNALYFGKIHIACVTLPLGASDADSQEPGFDLLKAMLPGMSVGILHLACYQEGLYLSARASAQIRSLEDLCDSGLTFLNREKGSAQRMLLDRELQKRSLDPSRISGYSREVLSHLAAASSVIAGEAQAALGCQTLMARFPGLRFLPLWKTRLSLVFDRSLLNSPLLENLRQIIDSEDFRRTLSGIPGYDLSGLGCLDIIR